MADDERIFVYLARHRLLVLDAASGKEVATFDNAATCELLLFLQGFLFQYDRGGHLRVLDATTGAIAWEKTFAADYGWETAGDRMVADHNAVYLIYRAEHAGALHLCALELANGHPRWDIVPTDIQMDGKALDTFNLVSCVHDRLVLSNVSRIVKPTKCANFVLSTTDGHVLWSNSYAPTGHGGPATDVLALGEQLWLKTDKAWTAFDLTTGVAGALGTHPQQQCYPDHATPRYILGGQMHFVDTKTSEETLFAATRSGCGSGFLPANGLVYTFPTRCDCYPLLRGYFGLTPVSGLSAEPDDDMSGRLERAPTDTRALVPTTSDDWPTYRHDASRSGSSPTPPPAEPRLRWTLQLGASLTAPTIAGGKVYLAVTDTGEVLALDALTGAKSWSFLTGGAVCTPPTLYGGMALVGCADGWVYSLRAENGTLVWRFRAAPDDRRIVVRGKLESLWPVDNGVLVKDGVAYVVAGRHSYTDNGLFLYALDPLSGKLIWVTRRQRADGSELADMLLIDGNTLYLGGADQFDLKTGKPLDSGAGAMLWAPHTFLGDYSAVSNRGGNDNWRGTWAYTDKKGVRALNIYVGGRYAERTWAARGNLLVDKQGMAYGVIQGAVVKDEPSESALFRQPLGQARSWTTPLPPIGEETVTALLLAGDTLVAGGASTDKEKGRNGKLWLYAADNGALRCAFDLPSVPRWDSLAAAADGTLFLTTETGSLLCVGK